MNYVLMDLSASNVSLICNFVFLGILILCTLSCLTGLKKGLIKSSLNLVVWLILVIIVYFCNVNFTKMVFNTDISFIINGFSLPNGIVINEVNISLTQTLGEIVGDILKAYNIASSQNAVVALATSILSFFVLIINMLLCLFIAPIVKFLLYILLVRPIFKKIMKNHKLRLGGLCVNGLKTLIVSCAFLMPLFSTAEVLIKNYNDALEEGYTYDAKVSNSFWNILYPIFNGYNSSFLHYTFSLITGQGTNISYYTVKVKDSNTKVNFVELLGDVFSVTCSTLSVAEDVSQGAIVSAVLSDHTLELLTTKVLDNSFLVKEVLPLAASISLNLITEGNDNFILSKEEAQELTLEIENLDFGKDLSSYIELFRILNEKNYIKDAIDSSINEGYFNYELSRDNQNQLNKGLNKFKELQDSIKNNGKKTLLEVVLPPVIASLIKNANESIGTENTSNADLLSIFPTEADEYRKYDIVEFIQYISDILFNFADLYKVSKGSETNIGISDLGSIETPVIMDIFFSERIVDGTSIKTMDLFTGRSSNNQLIDHGLLDIPFVLDSIPGLLDYALGMIDETIISSDTLQKIKDDISSLSNTKETWSNEFSLMFNFISKLYDKEELPILLKGENGIVMQEGFAFDLANESQRNILKSAISCIGNSKIIPCIMEQIITTGLNINWTDLGITPSNFNFKMFTEGSNLSTELIDLIDAFAYATPLFDLDESENIFNSGLTSNDLRMILSTLVDCEIVNPSADLITIKEHNVLRQIILKLFNDENLTSIGFSLSEETYDNCKDLSIEFENIVSIFEVFENDDSLNSILSGKELSINDLNGASISNLISAIADSDFLRPSLTTILEKNVSPIIDSTGINPNYFDFNVFENSSSTELEKIKMWKNEGQVFGNVIDDIKVLLPENSSEIDLNSILSDSTNKTTLEDLLKQLVRLNMLSSDYYFDNDSFIYDRIGLILLDLIQPVLKDYISEDSSSYESVKHDFSFAKNDLNYVKADNQPSTLTRNEKWDQEITYLCDVIFQIDDLQNEEGNIVIDLSDNSKISLIKNLVIGNSELSGINDLICMRTILKNIISSALNDIFSDQNKTFNDVLQISDSIVYTDFFENELNYESTEFNSFVEENVSLEDRTSLSTRGIEQLVRKTELIKIFDLIETIVDNSDLFESATFKISDIKLLFKELLLDLHDCLITHNAKLKLLSENSNKLTVFENMVFVIMQKSNLDEITYNGLHASTDSEYMKYKINKITEVEYFTIGGVLQEEGVYRTWKNEIDSLNSILNSDAVTDLIESNILNTNDYATINNEVLNEILRKMNVSYLLHDGVEYVTKTLLEGVNINQYRIDINEANTEIKYAIDQELVTFLEKVTIWNGEIDNITDLKQHLTYSDSNGEHLLDLEGYDITSNIIKCEDVLPIVYQSKVIKPIYYDFIYKLIDQVGLAEYISDVSSSPVPYVGYEDNYGGNQNKIKRDTLKFLGEERIKQRTEVTTSDNTYSSWAYEGKCIDGFISILKDNTSLIMEGDLTTENINLISQIFSVTYEYLGSIYDYQYEATSIENSQAISDMVNEEKYNRSYLISEMVLNLFDSKASPLGISLFNDYKYDYTYRCFNNYEKDSMECIFAMRSQFSNISSIDDLLVLLSHENFRKLGPGYDEYISVNRDENTIILSDGKNSNVAVQLINSAYLEDALRESSSLVSMLEPILLYRGMTIDDFFDGTLFSIDNNYTIEKNTDFWKERITTRLGL